MSDEGPYAEGLSTSTPPSVDPMAAVRQALAEMRERLAFLGAHAPGHNTTDEVCPGCAAELSVADLDAALDVLDGVVELAESPAWIGPPGDRQPAVSLADLRAVLAGIGGAR